MTTPQAVDNEMSGTRRPRLRVIVARVRASFPPAVAELILGVVKKTRLRRGEKVAVAQELMDDFRQGLEEGASAEKLIETFGDARQAATLIRRAKIRCRAWWDLCFWRSFRATAIGVPSVFVLYTLVCLYYFTGTPTFAVDYMAVMNERAAAVPEEDRAWPLYREALVAMGYRVGMDRWAPFENQDEYGQVYSTQPGDPHWLEVARFLDEHRAELGKIIAAAQKPGLGFFKTQRPDLADRVLIDDEHWNHYFEQPARTERYESNLDDHVFARVVDLLALEVHRGLELSDAERVMAALRVFPGVARHREEHWAESDALRIYRRGLIQILRVLGDNSELLSDIQLRELAHTYAGNEPLIALDLKGSRIELLHEAQSLFTDDGNGDGRLILSRLPGTSGLSVRPRTVVGALMYEPGEFFGAARWMFAHSRRAFIEEGNAILDRHEEESHKPLWESSPIGNWVLTEENATEYGMIERRLLFYSFGYAPLRTADKVRIEEITRGWRDATLCVIALHVYQKQRGHWPESLNELVPLYLPAAPVDRYSGQSLRYRVEDGLPMLYSVGVDGDDDEGRVSPLFAMDASSHILTYEFLADWMSQGYPLKNVPEGMKYASHPNVDGDWVFWPLKTE